MKGLLVSLCFLFLSCGAINFGLAKSYTFELSGFKGSMEPTVLSDHTIHGSFLITVGVRTFDGNLYGNITNSGDAVQIQFSIDGLNPFVVLANNHGSWLEGFAQGSGFEMAFFHADVSK